MIGDRAPSCRAAAFGQSDRPGFCRFLSWSGLRLGALIEVGEQPPDLTIRHRLVRARSTVIRCLFALWREQIACSSAIGILFGLLPAERAARLDPAAVLKSALEPIRGLLAVFA